MACWYRPDEPPLGPDGCLDPLAAVVLCDTRIGRGVPFLETREKAHFIRIDEHEWDLARQALRAANPAGSN